MNTIYRKNRQFITYLAFISENESLDYVDGKLEGQSGRVVEVAYNFKIKVSDYKRVIGLADTEVHGQFFNAGSHFITFDSAALPQGKIVTWYKAPAKEDDEYVSGSDDSSFRLDDLKSMKISAAIAERGHDYYMEVGFYLTDAWQSTGKNSKEIRQLAYIRKFELVE